MRWGMGGTPMVNRTAGAPRVRGTRTPRLAAALSAYLMTAPRKGRGVLLSGFAGEVLASSTLPSRPEKRLFLGVNALFFIARNEGSSMTSDNYTCIHRMKYDKRKTTSQKTRENCALLGSRFKILLADAGLTPESAGKLLHVTPRTIRYWISGKVRVPYAAYKLVRIMRLFELPCKGWDGWHMHSGKLWSPEGFGFVPSDSSWWGLLVRQARGFKTMYDRETMLLAAGVSADRAAVSASEAAAAAGPREAHPVGNTGITIGVTSFTGVAHG